MIKFILAILFIVPIPVLAIEGTCSYHGGVDCSAMADWDGSAVCNDGWRDSSETFYSVQECKVNKHFCTADEMIQIDSKYGIPEKRTKMEEISNQIAAINNQTRVANLALENQGGAITSGGVSLSQAANNREAAIKVLNLLGKYQSAQGEYWSSQNQSDRECYALGDERYRQQQIDFYNQYLNLLQQDQSTQNIPTQNQPQITPSQSQFLQTKCATNYHLVDSQCVCDAGYYQYNNQCIDSLSYCSIKLGDYGIVSGQNSCGCAEGYVLNDLENFCILKSVKKQISLEVETSNIKTISAPESNKTIDKIIGDKPIKTQEILSDIKATTSATTSKANVSVRNSLFEKITSWFKSWFK